MKIIFDMKINLIVFLHVQIISEWKHGIIFCKLIFVHVCLHKSKRQYFCQVLGGGIYLILLFMC